MDTTIVIFIHFEGFINFDVSSTLRITTMVEFHIYKFELYWCRKSRICSSKFCDIKSQKPGVRHIFLKSIHCNNYGEIFGFPASLVSLLRP